MSVPCHFSFAWASDNLETFPSQAQEALRERKPLLVSSLPLLLAVIVPLREQWWHVSVVFQASGELTLTATTPKAALFETDALASGAQI